MKISKSTFGKHNGKEVFLFTLENDNKVTVTITNYGGIVTSILVPDKDGVVENICLGFDKLEDYLKDHPYFGCIVGRYANRIAKGRFILHGVEYNLAINNGPNSLHGGLKGFDKVVWDSSMIDNQDEVSVKLDYKSKDMEEGYPGNLDTEVIYSLNNNNELRIDYIAHTDKTTPVNLTNHSYFNLNACKSDVLEHEITLFSKTYTPSDENLIPTGEIAIVAGTPYDLTKPKKIGAAFSSLENGYDTNFILGDDDGVLKHAALVIEKLSGRKLDVYTTEPAIQFYTGNFLDGTLKNGAKIFKKQYGFCLEAQHYPDSPNKPDFPSTIVEPGEAYQQTTVYRFGII